MESGVAQAQRDSIQLRYQLAGTGAFTAGLPNGPMVLVVDDDAAMTRFIGAVLGASGISAVSAYDPIQGFLVAQRQRPRVILVDWHMPAGGGPQLLRRLQEHSHTATIPAYVITADGAPGLPDEAAALGARGLLHKPIDVPALVALVTPLVS
jgi:two-component system chemotaxis response regulator CheY